MFKKYFKNVKSLVSSGWNDVAIILSCLTATILLFTSHKTLTLSFISVINGALIKTSSKGFSETSFITFLF